MAATRFLFLPILLAAAWAVPEPTPQFSPEQRGYWAFQKPVARPLPRTAAPVANPIDAFIVAKLEAAGLSLAEPADKPTLFRRAKLDLLGWSPSLAETEQFAEDDTAEAYERAVEAMLGSEHYGERWARHWLDLVRYADSDGYKSDVYRPAAWRYRDYVIRSLNQDKPYDRFLQEQLAGDELFPEEADALIATGYLRHWPYEDNQIDVKSQWEGILADITEVTSEVFLGLGIKCAKCHDHKYDPLPQADYFRLQAFFAGIMPQSEESMNPTAAIQAHQTNVGPWETATATVRGEMAKLTEPLESKRYRAIHQRFPDYLQAVFNKEPKTRTPLDQQMIHMGKLQVSNRGGKMEMSTPAKERYQQLQEELKQFDHLKPAALPAVMGVRDVGAEAPPTSYGEGKRARAVEPGFLTILAPGAAKIDPVPGNAQTTGRRAALARWLSDPSHPLTARVMVNRVWQQHFGVGLVATANDFGKQGAAPSHPELLDWLAVWFADNGWSLKKLHRLIMTSQTYRQSANRDMPSAAEHVDPENKLLWRMRTRRLEAEQIRDTMLAVSGELRHGLGGEGVKGEVPRRSIYVRNIRNTHDELLRGFDAADMFNSCACRDVTSTPLQSLMLLNGQWTLDRAKTLAESLPETEPSAFVRAAYRRVLAREPSALEMAKGVDFLNLGGVEARVDFSHVLLNTNEFLFAD